MREGFIQSYDARRRIGTIVSGLDRFWFHADRINHGPVDPVINSLVTFEILQKPILPGKLAVATDIVIEDLTTGQDALASQAGDKAAI